MYEETVAVVTPVDVFVVDFTVAVIDLVVNGIWLSPLALPLLLPLESLPLPVPQPSSLPPPLPFPLPLPPAPLPGVGSGVASGFVTAVKR